MALLSGDPERRIGRAVALVSATPLDDLEDKAFAPVGRIELEILAMLVAVVENVFGAKAIRQFRLQAEACLHIVVIVGRKHQRLEPIRFQDPGGGKDVVGGEGHMLHA